MQDKYVTPKIAQIISDYETGAQMVSKSDDNSDIPATDAKNNVINNCYVEILLILAIPKNPG